MATATAPVELETVPTASNKKEKQSRPRPNVNIIKTDGAGFNLPVFDTEELAEKNPPKVAPVDDKENPIVDKAIPVEGYRLCRVIHVASKKTSYTWARTTDLAIANVAGKDYTSEFTDAKKRGRSARIDPIYSMFLGTLIASKNKKSVEEFLVQFPQYKQPASEMPGFKELGIAA
jgi:hypothetical protein